MGDFLRHESDQDEANTLLERVGRDVDSIYQKKVNRYKVSVQIHSSHGITRSADLIEEVIFAGDDDGLLTYRYKVSRQMSFIKSRNIDLFVAATAIVLVPLVLFGIVLKKVACLRSLKKCPSSKQDQK